MNGHGTEGSSDDDHGILKKEQTPSYVYPLLDNAQQILRRINGKTIVIVERKLQELRENAQLLDHDSVDLTIWNKIYKIIAELEDEVGGLGLNVLTFLICSRPPSVAEISNDDEDICGICGEHTGPHFSEDDQGY